MAAKTASEDRLYIGTMALNRGALKSRVRKIGLWAAGASSRKIGELSKLFDLPTFAPWEIGSYWSFGST